MLHFNHLGVETQSSVSLQNMIKIQIFPTNFIFKRQRRFLFRIVAVSVLLTFSSSEIFPASLTSSQAYAQTVLDLPVPGAMVEFTPPLTPPLLIGLKIHPEHPLKFDFLLDRGDVKKLDGSELKNESTRLIKYFFSGPNHSGKRSVGQSFAV